MRLRLTGLLFILSLPAMLWGADVSLPAARKQAQAFMKGSKLSEDAYCAKGNTYYIFNVEGDGGFVIMAGDDRAPAVLAYARQGNIEYDDLPCSVKSVLDDYASQILSIRKGAQPVDMTLQSEPVPMLMKSLWGQEAPYHNKCLLFDRKAPTGCVATAMSQVIYYHRAQLPNKLTTAIPGYTCRTDWTIGDQKRRLKVKGIPAGSPLDWSHMRDTYEESDADKGCEAVASLMRYCGVAVEMEYREKEAAANVWSVPVAMKKYFGYSQHARIRSRALMTADAWEQLLTGELQAGRPVILSGETVCGNGHVFVCDGTDGKGHYHLNWGWKGLGNGYFRLSPFIEGVNGTAAPTDAAKAGSFGRKLHAVVGLAPGDGTSYTEPPCLTTIGFALGKVANKRFTEVKEPQTLKRKNDKADVRFGFQLFLRNQTASTASFESALALYDKKERLVQIIDHSQDTYQAFNKIQTKINAHEFDFGASIRKGLYRIRPVSRKKGASEWLLNEDFLEGCYIEAVVKKKEITFRLVTPEPVADKKKKKKKKK